jgi:polysaccharide export outer membrane protein
MSPVKILIAICLLACSLCWAQATSQEESLPIGPGDLVQIQVLGTPDLAQTVRVTDAGMITLIIGGDVKLSGLTPAVAAHTIEKKLLDGQYLIDPHVSVVVTQYATQQVSVLGQVRNPGAYPINTPRTVVDVLALAGGLNDAADRTVTIERRITKEHIDYFVSNNSEKAFDKNVLVYPGDAVLVPKAKLVYVLGDVGKPGGYPWVTNDSKVSVLQAISFAGGTMNHAVPSSTRLIRKTPDGTYEERKIQLSDMQKGKIPDMELQADDIIYVPFSYMRNLALSLGGIVAATGSAAIHAGGF